MALDKLDHVERSGCSNSWWFDTVEMALPVVELECLDTTSPVDGPWEKGTKGSSVASNWTAVPARRCVDMN